MVELLKSYGKGRDLLAVMEREDDVGPARPGKRGHATAIEMD